MNDEVPKEPDWLASWRATQAPEPVPLRTAEGKFIAGRSGNPSGRPPGIADKRNRVAKAFDQEFDAIGEALVKAAKDGDVAAMALYLSRVEPPLRPRAEKVRFQLSPELPLSQQAQEVLVAVAGEVLDPGTGKLIIDCITAAAGLKSIDEFEERLQRLEANTARSVRGGIVEQRMQ